MCQKLYKIQFYQWVRRNRGKRGKSVGKRVQHTPPTGTTLTEFRRFLNIDFGTLRTNAKSAHTFAPLTAKSAKRLIDVAFTGFRPRPVTAAVAWIWTALYMLRRHRSRLHPA